MNRKHALAIAASTATAVIGLAVFALPAVARADGYEDDSAPAPRYQDYDQTPPPSSYGSYDAPQAPADGGRTTYGEDSRSGERDRRHHHHRHHHDGDHHSKGHCDKH